MKSLDPNIQRVTFEYTKFDMHQVSTVPVLIKGRTIRKLMGGGGGGGEVQTKHSRKGKVNEKKFMHAN